MSKWETKPLGSLCLLKKGQQINLTELEKFGEYYVLNGGVDPSGYYDKCNTPANVISISEGGNSCGYVNFNSKPFWSGGHNYTLTNLISKVSLSYLFQYLKYKQFEIMQLRQGSGLPNIQRKPLQEFLIKKPTDKIEADKIAEVLSSVDENIEQTKSIIEKYKNIKVAMVQELIKGGTIKKQIKDCLSFLRPDKYIENDIKLYGDIPVLTANKAFILGYTNNYLNIYYKIPVIVFDDFTTDFKFVDFPFKVRSSAIKILYPKKDIDLYYFSVLLQTTGFTAAEHKRHYISEYSKVFVKVHSYPEQIDISKNFLAIDNKIKTEQKYLDKLLKLKQGLMQDLLTNKVSVLPLLKKEI